MYKNWLGGFLLLPDFSRNRESVEDITDTCWPTFLLWQRQFKSALSNVPLGLGILAQRGFP